MTNALDHRNRNHNRATVIAGGITDHGGIQLNNPYGLDANYFREALGLIVRDVEQYTPGEMWLALTRLGNVARHQHETKAAADAKKARGE